MLGVREILCGLSEVPRTTWTAWELFKLKSAFLFNAVYFGTCLYCEDYVGAVPRYLEYAGTFLHRVECVEAAS